MFGILYILLSIVVGFTITSICLPKLNTITSKTYTGKNIKVSPLLFLFPFWYGVGTLIMTWFTYFTAYILHVCFNVGNPLLFANLIVMSTLSILCVIGILYLNRKDYLIDIFKSCKKIYINDILLVISITIVGIIIMFGSFFYKDNSFWVSESVVSDFSCHLGMIRSFSVSNNYPTQYIMFGAADIKYHFMFQFLVGNLEYLGLRLDLAFNIPSIISFVGMLSVLYVLALKLTNNRFVGWMITILYYFRSSLSVFKYLSEQPKNTLINSLNKNELLDYTPCEGWGLWNIKVPMNQRHLQFGMIILFCIIIIMLPYLYKSINRISQFIKAKQVSKKEKVLLSIKYSLLHKKGWLTKNYIKAIFLGLVLGMLSFFHGSCVIACLAMLFFIAIVSDNRLEFIIIAVITLALTLFNTHFFIDGSTIDPQIYIGFLAERQTLIGIISYIVECFGIFALMLIIVFAISNNISRYVYFIFLVPSIIAFTLSLTPDIAVNHKYVIISICLLNIPISLVLYKLFIRPSIFSKFISILCIIALVGTGLYENQIIMHWNIDTSFHVDNNDPRLDWMIKNTTEKDLILSGPYAQDIYMMSGCMLYEGYAYYVASAGYDYDYRYNLILQLAYASSREEVLELVKKMNVDYIIIDNCWRSEYYNKESYLYYVNHIKYGDTVNTEYLENILNDVYNKSEAELILTTTQQEKIIEDYIKDLFVKVADFPDIQNTQIYDTHQIYVYE